MTEKQTRAGQEIARKLTIGVVGGKATEWFERLAASESKRLELCSIYGIATGFLPGSGDYGEYLKFRGQFRGVSKLTGEITNAPTVILPNHLAEGLRAALEGAGEGVKSVQFAIDVDVVYDVTAATKYRYVTRDMLPADASDPLTNIENRVRETLALAAPKAPEAAAPAAPATSGKRK